MKYLVHEVRSQKTREMIVKFRAPEKVKEIQPDGHFKWKKGFEHIDANTIILFGRKIIFREMIFVAVSADDSQFWRNEHAEIVLDFTKRSVEDAEHRRSVEGRPEENKDSGEESGNQKSQRGLKKIAPKVKMR